MLEGISANEVIELAREFHVDQSDTLERFICELLQIDVNDLYEYLDGNKDI